MDQSAPGQPDPELQRIGDQLRAGRPELPPLELDRVKTSVLARVAQPQRRRGVVAGRRLAAVAAISLGVFAGTSGVTLGVVTLANPGSAADIEYAPPVHNPDQGGVLGEHGGGSRHPNNNTGPPSGTLGENGGGHATLVGVQAGRQLASANAGSLPFTGYLAIPALAVGVLLTGFGLLLRRRLGNTAP
jgi:hypothetical protein